MSIYERAETIRGVKVIRLKSGRLLTAWDAMRAAESARATFALAMSRAFKLAEEKYDPGLERLELLIEGAEDYLRHMRGELDKRRGTLSKQERIALLRHTTGRTPEEAAAFHAKADELERDLGS
jgi:hypothetical protein